MLYCRFKCVLICVVSVYCVRLFVMLVFVFCLLLLFVLLCSFVVFFVIIIIIIMCCYPRVVLCFCGACFKGCVLGAFRCWVVHRFVCFGVRALRGVLWAACFGGFALGGCFGGGSLWGVP